jgi:hypothetical protein
MGFKSDKLILGEKFRAVKTNLHNSLGVKSFQGSKVEVRDSCLLDQSNAFS